MSTWNPGGRTLHGVLTISFLNLVGRFLKSSTLPAREFTAAPNGCDESKRSSIILETKQSSSFLESHFRSVLFCGRVKKNNGFLAEKPFASPYLSLTQAGLGPIPGMSTDWISMGLMIS